MRIKDKDAVDIATSKSELNIRRMKKDSNFNLHFGSFIKTSTLQDGKDSINNNDNEPVMDKSASMSEFPSALNDEALFKACGGRTAHKGARHGHTLSGKIARLQQQEDELLAKMKNSSNSSEASTSSPWTQFESKKTKKNRKRKIEKMDQDDGTEDNSSKTEIDNAGSVTDDSQNTLVPLLDSGDSEILPKVKSKRARLREKRKFENLSIQMEKSLDLTAKDDTLAEPEEEEKKKKGKSGSEKKKSRKKRAKIEVVNLDEEIELVNLEDEIADDAGFYEINVEEKKISKSKKKRKRKSSKEVMNADTLNNKISMRKMKKLEKKKNDKLEKLSESLITLALNDAIVDNVTTKVSKKKKKKKSSEKKSKKTEKSIKLHISIEK